jgi:hypothetical protein
VKALGQVKAERTSPNVAVAVQESSVWTSPRRRMTKLSDRRRKRPVGCNNR